MTNYREGKRKPRQGTRRRAGVTRVPKKMGGKWRNRRSDKALARLKWAKRPENRGITTRARSDRTEARTKASQAAFLLAVLQDKSITITRAAAAADVDRRTVYKWEAVDKGFARRWRHALKFGSDARLVALRAAGTAGEHQATPPAPAAAPRPASLPAADSANGSDVMRALRALLGDHSAPTAEDRSAEPQSEEQNLDGFTHNTTPASVAARAPQASTADDEAGPDAERERAGRIAAADAERRSQAVEIAQQERARRSFPVVVARGRRPWTAG